MELPFTPVNGWIVVERDTVPGKYGEIILPEARSQRPVSGVVVQTSEGCSPYLKPGVKIGFGPFSGELVAVEDKELLMLTEPEILFWVDEDATS